MQEQESRITIEKTESSEDLEDEFAFYIMTILIEPDLFRELSTVMKSFTGTIEILDQYAEIIESESSAITQLDLNKINSRLQTEEAEEIQELTQLMEKKNRNSRLYQILPSFSIWRERR